ncbi:MAG: hypothetical protein Q9202_002999 [Teloschistes flavicans]
MDDIAGIGIYTSYWMQNAIALTAWALLRHFYFWLYYALLGFFLLVSPDQAYEKAGRIRRMNLRYRIPNLISALVEFQKAQCFFMIAVQVAAIIIARKGGFQAQNLQQLSNSYSAMTLLAICGYLPVLFTLLNLHGAGKSSWYLMVLSTITVIISGVTVFTTRRFDPAPVDLAHLYNITGHWASCGFHDPTTWCLNHQTIDPFSYPGGAEHAFIFCTILLAFLFLDKLRTSPLIRKRVWNSGGRLSSMAKPYSQRLLTQRLSSMAKPYSQRLLTQRLSLYPVSSMPSIYNKFTSINKQCSSNLLYGCVWVLFLFLYIRVLHLLSQWLNQSSGLRGPQTWTFGQIVGITVWMPSLIQYLYLETCGMTAWFEQHIAGEYHIHENILPEET